MAPIVKPQPQSKLRPRVLVVDDEPNLVELIGDVTRDTMNCQMLTAANLKEANKILATQEIELLVTDVHLPDGDGMTLLPSLRKHQPLASAIVITGSPTVDGAICALRHGALDFVPKPFSSSQLVDRIRKALDRQAAMAKQERRLDRLRDAVKRLNAARKVVSKKVDLLCNDLVTAYGELSKQIDGVRTQEGFRKYVSGAKDLEQLLCHGMDWLLRQLGYSNVAVWLAGEDEDFQLGAYMKYTVAGENALTAALKREVLPLAVKDGIVQMPASDLASKFTPQEYHFLQDQELLAVNCTYLGEPLAVIMFFRDTRTPFTEEDKTTLQSISPIFAVALSSVVSDGQEGPDVESPFYDGDTAERDEDADDKKDRKRDAAD